MRTYWKIFLSLSDPDKRQSEKSKPEPYLTELGTKNVGLFPEARINKESSLKNI